MKPEDMSVVLRERRGMEGAELGVRLLQANTGAVYRPWLMVMVPLLGCCLATGLVQPLLASFLLWWLAPIGERVVVMVLSRAAFNQKLGVRAALAETWRRGRNGLLLQLTLLRLSPNRGMMTPVMMLEQPDFAAYQRRGRALLRGNNGALGLTVAFVHAEMFIQLSAVVLGAMLLPQHAIQWHYWAEAALGSTGAHMMNLAYAATILAVRPFYAAGGFGLYLARRTNLEGWDIELVFRSLAKRLLPAMAALLVLGCLLPNPVVGADATADPKALIGEIVEEPPFRIEVERTQYFDFSWLRDWLNQGDGDASGIPAAMAFVLRLGAVVALGVLLYLLVRLCMKVVVPPAPVADPRASDTAGVRFLEGVNGALAMPNDPAGAARELAEAGRLREALAILIGGAILRVRERFAVVIPAAATEGDCRRSVEAGAPVAAQGHFRDLLRSWELVAYAGRRVPTAEVIRLADTFDQAYQRSAGGEPAS